MPSPFGHAVVGIGVAGAAAGALGAPNDPALWAGGALAGCLPDLDLVPCLWGVPYQRVHRQAGHSMLILGTLIVTGWLAMHALGLLVDWRLVAAWTAALVSHLVLDVLCTGPAVGRRDYGIPLLWPLMSRRWSVRRPVIPEVNLLEGISPGKIARACLQEFLRLSPAALVLILLGYLV